MAAPPATDPANAAVDPQTNAPHPEPPPPIGYAALIDEYSVARNAEQSQYATPDIVSPADVARDAIHFADPAATADLVELLSTSSGCLNWIRAQLLTQESQFTAPQQLRIFATTWNVNGKKPLVRLDPWLLSDDNREQPPDVYVVAFQEVQPLSGFSVVATDDTRGSAWRRAVETCVAKLDDYQTIGAKQMVGVFLIVLVKTVHRPFVQSIALTEAGTGFMRTGGNKGAVACRFVIYDKSICCLSSHLAAHEHNFERRNQDFHDVVRKSVFYVSNPDVSPFSYRETQDNHDNNNNASPASSDPELKRLGSRYDSITEPTSTINLLDHDIVIWAGDLNYRIDDLSVEKVAEHISNKEWPYLTKCDQLLNAMKKEIAFQGFEEMQLDFAPTYKHQLFADGYAMDEEENVLKRTPAWTDRVLWRQRDSPAVFAASTVPADSNTQAPVTNGVANGDKHHSEGKLRTLASNTIRASAYIRHELFSSDHRPVSAIFDIDATKIDIDARNRIVGDVHRIFRKRQNLLRPRLLISTTVIDLGAVEFDKPVMSALPLTLRNVGHVTISIDIDDGDLPCWLHAADPESGIAFTLSPSEEKQVHFRAHVQGGTGLSTQLNVKMDKLTACVPLSIQGKAEAFISVLGDYQPTCFGNTISDLAAHPQPFRAVDTDTAQATVSNRALAVPKELHLLVSFLLQGCTQLRNAALTNASLVTASSKQQANGGGSIEAAAAVAVEEGECEKKDKCALHTNEQLFLQESQHSEIEAVRRCMDEMSVIRSDTNVAAVASCLVALLESLEEAVIPFSCCDAILQVASKDDMSLDDVRSTLEKQHAMAPVFNTLVYLFALLNELPSAKRGKVVDDGSGAKRILEFENDRDGEYVHQVLAMFAKVVLKAPEANGVVGVAVEAEREEFVKRMLVLCRESELQATFDYLPGLEGA